MSRQNVDLVRAVYEEWAKGNFTVGGELWDSRVVFIPVADLPDAGVYFGVDGITSFMRDFLAPWTNYTIAAEDSSRRETASSEWRACEGRGVRAGSSPTWRSSSRCGRSADAARSGSKPFGTERLRWKRSG
jgi:ketosteroid isomerase-like protein